MSLLESYRSARRWVTRGQMEKLPAPTHNFDEVKVQEAIGYANKTTDRDSFEKLQKKRFGLGIKQRKAINPTTGATVWDDGYGEYYTRTEVIDAIDMGMYECVITGIGGRIAEAVATLTTQPDQHWGYIDTDSKKDEESDEVAELIKLVRQEGGFYQSFEALDFAASVIELSYMHIFGKGVDLAYDVVLPYNIWIVHGETVTSHVEAPRRFWPAKKDAFDRPADPMDLEDASAVIIKTVSAASHANNTYLAYVGGCTNHPDGRMVTYQAQQAWPIPEIEDENIIKEYEWYEGGGSCNPLTRMLNYGDRTQKRAIATEYPIIPWRGGHRTINDETMPVSTSLHEASIELELAWSRALKYGLDNMRGKDVFGFKQGADTALPRSLDVITLKEGQEYQKIFGGAAEGDAAVGIITNLAKQLAGGYHVPGYIILDHEGIPESGIALAIQSQPLIDFRNRRKRINEEAAARIFDVERALMTCYWLNDIIKPSIQQKWDPGTWVPPRDETTRLDEMLKAREAEAIDHYEFLRRFHHLATIEEAIALEKQFDKRDDDYGKKPEPEKPKPPTGLFGEA